MPDSLDARVLAAFEEALDWPPDQWEAGLAAMERLDPEVAPRLRGMLAGEAWARAALPTEVQPLFRDFVQSTLPRRIGPYRITRELGEGGMGIVLLGERDDGLFEQHVAIKLIASAQASPALVEQFSRERQFLARLRHPNIAQIFDAGTDDHGRPYFIMELVPGVPLHRYVAGQRPGPRQVAALMVTVCAAVQHAHRNLIVHADIKPANILVDEAGQPKLLDFGIGRSLADEGAQAIGLTPGYASPQREAGETPTPADDIYALGMVLWEVASGTPPGPDMHGLQPGYDGEFAAIIRKAIAMEAPARYDSAGALADDLTRWLARYPVLAGQPGWRRSFRLLERRRPLAVLAGQTAFAALVCALALITGLYLQAERERREADAGFARARGMARYMLFDLFDRLSDAPGTLPIRRELADQARFYLQDLAGAPRAPVEVRAEAATGFMQLAGIEALFSAGSLGERAAAETSLARAAALLEGASAADRANPRWRYARGRLLLFQGFRVDDQGGGPAAARPMLEEAVALLAQATAELPDDVEIAADLWQARLTLADIMGNLLDPTTQLDVAQRTLAAPPGVLERSEKLPLLRARSHRQAGDALYAMRGAAASLAAYEQSEALLAAEDTARPRRSRTLMELAVARWNLGSVLAELGREEDGLRQYEQGIAANRTRLAVEPDHDGLRRMLDLLESERAGLLARMGRVAEAQAAARANLESRREGLAARPGDQVAERNLLAGLRPAGDVFLRTGDSATACAHYREAQAGYRGFMERFALAPRVVAGELSLIEARLRGCAALSAAPAPPG